MKTVLGKKKEILVMAFLAIMMIPPTVCASVYQTEFNNPDEKTRTVSSWQYETKDGGLQWVDVYEYCKDTDCILVAFDTLNKKELSNQECSGFFQNYNLQQEIDKGNLNEDVYALQSDHSITCDFFVPQFPDQLKAGTIEVTADKILPELLPKNLGALVTKVYSLGKDLELIDSVNPTVLVLGASCLGGEYFENIAFSTLESCKASVKNLKAYKAYEGQPEDLFNCHKKAIDNLNLAKNSPNLLTQNLEVQLSNTGKEAQYQVDSASCKLLGWLTGPCDPLKQALDVSSLDKFISKVNTLGDIKIDIAGIKSESGQQSTTSTKRIADKSNEAANAISMLQSKIESEEEKLQEKNGLEIQLKNLVLAPAYDFSMAETEISKANQNKVNAELLKETYRFNSAAIQAKEGVFHAETASTLRYQEENKPRGLNFINLTILGAIILILLAIKPKKPKAQRIRYNAPPNDVNSTGLDRNNASRYR